VWDGSWSLGEGGGSHNMPLWGLLHSRVQLYEDAGYTTFASFFLSVQRRRALTSFVVQRWLASVLKTNLDYECPKHKLLII
jgi:hypothetical protein